MGELRLPHQEAVAGLPARAMIVVYGSDALPPPPRDGGARAVAIGNFDGVHRGHRHVLSRLSSLAGSADLPTWVYTFDPPPTAVLAPERHQPRLMTLARKLELLEAIGVDGVVVEAFTHSFAAQSAAEFARSVLVSRLQSRAVVVGWDFRFGSGRGGDVDALRAALPAVVVEQVTPMIEGEGPISSSRIRRLIAAGDVVGAAGLLGRPHRLSGTVVHGDARGRAIGFPTANLQCDVECLPAFGVYAVDVGIGAGAAVRGVLNIGVRPTFQGSELRIEAHLLDWQGDLYGSELALDLVARIRDEQRFASVDALVAQIRLDADAARRLP